MKISIITIAYNSEETIEDTIESVVNQSYSDIEYIIVDGGSTDKTLEIIAKYKNQITVVVSEKDRGIYDAMNKGVKLATGDVVGILNSDDVYADNDVLTNISTEFENSHADAVYADLVYVERENTNKITRTWISGEYKEGAFKKGWMPPHPTFFLKNEMYLKFGTYTLKLKSAADYELMLRMVHKNKIKISYLNKVITKMRVGGVSNVSLKNRIAANREDKEAWKMNGLKPGAFTMVRKPLSKISQFLKK